MWLHLFLPFAFSSIFIIRFIDQPFQFLLLLIGILLGFAFILLDRLLHAIYVEPDTEFSLKIRSAGEQKNLKKLFLLIMQESALEQTRLISRSTIFMICYMAIAVYVVTSSTNLLGIGLVLGIGLHYCLDLLLFQPHPKSLTDHFLWQIKRTFKPAEINWLIGGFLFYFVMLSLLAIR